MRRSNGVQGTRQTLDSVPLPLPAAPASAFLHASCLGLIAPLGQAEGGRRCSTPVNPGVRRDHSAGFQSEGCNENHFAA